jgi:hypothetical protein
VAKKMENGKFDWWLLLVACEFKLPLLVARIKLLRQLKFVNSELRVLNFKLKSSGGATY